MARILIHSAPPWAHSGYGIQAGLAAKALISLGHQVAISAYAGVHRAGDEWEGVPVLGAGQKPYGNGLVPANHRRWHADVVVTLTDPWVLDPEQFAGLAVMPWMPADTEPLGVMDRQWLERVKNLGSVRPVAMSEFGARMLADAGWPGVPVVPHAVPPGICADEAAGQAWRASLGLSPDAFVISKIAVNTNDDRKALVPTLLAFAGFARLEKRARLYLHCEAQPRDGLNLAYLASALGLRGRVAFADQDRRAADLFTTADMRAVYCGTDLYDATALGEGFCVPLVEALACGTPVVASRNSATAEKVSPAWGWLVGGQRAWARHHNAWWQTPSVPELERTYRRAVGVAAQMRQAAARAGAKWGVGAMTAAWGKALSDLP